MTTLTGFRNIDGTVGIRNHLFMLPAVVCANQVAIDVARRHPNLKYIEHQHGCAQIGADLTQTGLVFSQLAIHPNAYASAFLSLGCEAILARDLFEKTRQKSTKPMELFVIQELGGTTNTSSKVAQWLSERSAESTSLSRVQIGWSDICVGLLLDDDASPEAGQLATKVIQALGDLGARVIVSASQVNLFREVNPSVAFADLGYGAFAGEAYSVMRGGSNPLEITTGFASAGANIILHLATKPHAFGNPLVPIDRFALQSDVYETFSEDFDGYLVDGSVDDLIEHLTQVINGDLTVAEEVGLDDFALYRIGPTV